MQIVRPRQYVSFSILTAASVLSFPVYADMSDCFWGGFNEETRYTSSYFPGQGGITLAQVPQPPLNLGAPQPAIPVAPTPGTTNVPQAAVPTVTIPVGPVGSVGQPATHRFAVANTAAGQEIIYVMPSNKPADAVCLDGTQQVPANEVKVVPAGTPGAIPVALKTVTVRRPKIEYRWVYAPVANTVDTQVNVVDPRTGRIVKTYCRQDEEKGWVPVLHRKEIVTYETVSAKVAVPVSVAPTAAGAANTAITNPSIQLPYQTNYLGEQVEGAEVQTVIIP